jgi:hypothetical protein
VAIETKEIAALGTGSAPLSYTVSGDQVFTLVGVRATFDGTAASAFLPCVRILSSAGHVLHQTIGTSVAAGASADVSFFPWSRRHVTRAGSSAYQDTIATLRATNQLIALWRLNEGATPYIDTSGYVPSDPANAARHILAVPMTQNYTPAALSNNQDASAVAFNADGSGGGNGDYLASAAVDNTRFAVLGNGNYTAIAWVRPFAGIASSLGGVVGTFQLHGWAPPAGNTTGFMLNVVQPAQTLTMTHFNSTTYGGTPATLSGSAISTGTWHMIACTYDGTNGRLYIDGSLNAGPTALAAGVASGNSPSIGLGQDSTATPEWFYGAIGEVSLWRAALTAGQISSLWTAGST